MPIYLVFPPDLDLTDLPVSLISAEMSDDCVCINLLFL